MEATSLELFLNNGDKYAFYPHECVLTESVSAVSSAELTLYSRAAFSLADLNALVGGPAALRIGQRRAVNDGTREVYRWFSGVVSAVAHAGVVQRNADSAVCRYRLTVSSPIIDLQYCSPCHYFSAHTLMEAVGEVLDEHNITYSFDEDIEVGGQRNYYQGEETDYAFVSRILGENGLNYTFVSTPVGEDGVPQFPEMRIFAGTPALPSEVSGIAAGETVEFHYGDAAGAAHVMTQWEMGAQLGVEKVILNYKSAGGRKSVTKSGREIAEGQEVSRCRVFDYSPFGTVDDSMAENSVANCMRYYDDSRLVWSGRTGALEAMVGQAINILGFSADPDETIEARILSSRLEVVAPWPSLLQVRSQQQPSLTIDLQCADRSNEDGALSATAGDTSRVLARTLTTATALSTTVALASKLTPKPEPAPTPAPVPTPVENPASALVFLGTVCDAQGNVSKKNTAAPLKYLSETVDGKTVNTDTYIFHVILDDANGSEKTEVQLTMPLGGAQQGFFRVPRIGERVVLLSDVNKSRYFLQSYLPDKNDMPFADSVVAQDGNYNSNDMTVLRHREAKESDSTACTSYPPEQKTSEQIKNAINAQIAANSDSVGSGIPNTRSEMGIYSGFDTVEEVKGVKSTKHVPVLMNLASAGNTVITANDRIAIQGKNITLSTPGWTKRAENGWNTDNGLIQLSDFNTLQVIAKHKIVFKVGNNTISITPNGIAISASKWAKSMGPMDSKIVMDGLSGVTMAGLRCSMFGAYGATVSDGIGASLKVGGGAASVSGGSVTLGTLGKGMAAARTAFVAAQCLMQGASFIAQNEVFDTVIRDINHLSNYGFDIWNFVEGFRGAMKQETTAQAAISIVTAVINLVTSTINTAVACADDWAPKGWLEQPAEGNKSLGTVTNRDALRLCALITSTITWSIGTVIVIAKMTRMKASRIKLDSTKITFDVESLDDLCIKKNSLQSILGGVNGDGEGGGAGEEEPPHEEEPHRDAHEEEQHQHDREEMERHARNIMEEPDEPH